MKNQACATVTKGCEAVTQLDGAAAAMCAGGRRYEEKKKKQNNLVLHGLQETRAAACVSCT